MKLAIEIWDKHIDVFMHFDIDYLKGSKYYSDANQNRNGIWKKHQLYELYKETTKS